MIEYGLLRKSVYINFLILVLLIHAIYYLIVRYIMLNMKILGNICELFSSGIRCYELGSPKYTVHTHGMFMGLFYK